MPLSHSKLLGRGADRFAFWACSHIFEYCGKNVNVEKGAKFGSGYKVRIGDNSEIRGNSCAGSTSWFAYSTPKLDNEPLYCYLFCVIWCHQKNG